jgi:transcription elongation factor GreA
MWPARAYQYASCRMSADAANLTTVEGLRELELELAALEGGGRREIAERIKTAREWGDLKENSEYHDAKNDQAHLETKIARLRERISTAEVVEESGVVDGAIGFGSTVVVRDEAGAERAWRIVSSHDASPSEGRLSADSPVARALLGCRTGERAAVVLPKGESILTVVSVA